MEIQLHELIAQIKKDGVDAAEDQASTIISEAQAQAEKIIADAQAQAEKILQNAKTENEKMVRSGEDAIRQAGRNLLISFRESVAKELQAITGEAVTAAYARENLSAMVLSVVENWTKNPENENLSVILNDQDLAALEATLLAALKEKMLQGVTLKASDSFDGGFRIAVADGSAYYDYSSEAVVEMLSGYLSPRVAQLLKEAQ